VAELAMRVFFALDISPPLQDAIARWRARAVAAAGRAVRPGNFHITLHFLGDIAPRQLDLLCAEAERIRADAFDLRLDQCGWFPRPGIFHLCPGDIPASLAELAAATRKAARNAERQSARQAGAAAPKSRKPYSPHLTLFRHCRVRPPLPTARPDFTVACDGFTLFESVAVADGVRYQPLQHWRAQA